ncbi:TonB-dependent receptor [Solirubrum puertoriconensis]|uniref:TonB-dependent receptor n=1 Tax=Solirubrum puertoriconensis TaxID=1751427 RepID=UPI00098F57EE|nr:TonB-dependent receptor [Solirubrum puertoriconensis]
MKLPLPHATSLGPRVALLLLAGLATHRSVQAQNPAAVSGSVRSAAGPAIDYATVTLHRAADSTVVKTEFSDDKGAFRFEQAAAGKYLISASQLGFVRQWSQPFEVASESVQVPALSLPVSATTQLKEVKVTGQRPTFEREADRTIVNVEGSTLAAGNTALEVLRRSPNVTVDNSDNIALRGRQGVMVLIDGRRMPMTGQELADYLRALPAEQVKNIELITNPPAKYEAAGSAGIISINLKKDQRLGTNGTFTGSYGRSQYNKFNTGLSLNHRRKGLNLFGSLNASDREGIAKLDITRNFYREGDRLTPGALPFRITEQQNRSPLDLRSLSWKGGLDYNLGERTVIGGVVSGLTNRVVQDGSNLTTIYGATRAQQTDRFRADNLRNSTSPNFAGNLNFRHTFKDSLGLRELTADADFARYITDRRQELRIFRDSQLNEVTLGDQDGRLTIQSAKVDYVQPLTKALRFEGGGKISHVYSDNNVVFTDGEGNIDLGRTNRFRYDEKIYAGYVNFNYTADKYTLQGGLRAESTDAEGKQEVIQEGVDPDFERNYFQLFPSAALKRKFSDKHETSLSLSRRIDRPSYGQLNPFRVIIDANTRGEGNPELLPQTSYNTELTHTFKQKYSAGLSYSITDNPMVGVVRPESATSVNVVSTTNNLDKQYYYALTLTAPIEIAKWWNMYNNAVFYYTRFKGNLVGTNLNAGRMTYTLSSNHNFLIGKGWSAELNGNYQARELYGFLDVRPLGQVAAGIQKSLWDKKANLKLSVSDIFFTSPVRATSTYANYVENFYQRQDSRQATLSFSYRFGNDKVAPTKRRQGGAEDEKRRAGGGS